MEYREHLQKEAYSITTVASYLVEVKKFKIWCTRNHYDILGIKYIVVMHK